MKFSKSDGRYWEGRLFREKYRHDGEIQETQSFCVRIQVRGKRVKFNLGTGNKREAGRKAREIWETISGHDGLETALKLYKPEGEKRVDVRVGEFLHAASAVIAVRQRTKSDYCRAFRQIVGEVWTIAETPDSQGVTRSRFDYKGGGAEAWRERVDQVPLRSVTPGKIHQWKLGCIAKVEGDPTAERRAKTSVNSIIRQARSLFSPEKVLCHLGNLELPSSLPFDGVKLFPKAEITSPRYVSKIDAGQILKEAMLELEGRPEELKILLLALVVGLRRSEIDKLLWSQIDFERAVVGIRETPYFRPKSADSEGEVDVDEEFLRILGAYREQAQGPFVVESSRQVNVNRSHSGTRCQRHFDALYRWLRTKGLHDQKPLHALRKEFGSLICQRAGVYAASRLLRHADIRVTAQHYLDKKERVTVELENLLK